MSNSNYYMIIMSQEKDIFSEMEGIETIMEMMSEIYWMIRKNTLNDWFDTNTEALDQIFESKEEVDKLIGLIERLANSHKSFNFINSVQETNYILFQLGMIFAMV